MNWNINGQQFGAMLNEMRQRIFDEFTAHTAEDWDKVTDFVCASIWPILEAGGISEVNLDGAWDGGNSQNHRNL